MIRSIFNFFLFSSLFISCCAVLMVLQTYQLLQPGYTNNALLYFTFFSTVCSYNLHWYFSPVIDSEKIRSQWTRRHRKLQGVLALLGAVGAIWFSFVLIDNLKWFLPAALLTFLYTAPKLPIPATGILKKIAVGKTIFLAFVWTYVTTALPLLVAGTPWTMPAVLFCLCRFFLIYAICILFDCRDREQDRKEGIRSFITFLSEKGIDRLFVTSFLLFVVSTSLLLLYNLQAHTIILLLVPGLLAALLYKHAKKNHSDYLYYFILDGLMMFSSLLTLLFSI